MHAACPHQVLAIERGEAQGLLSVRIEWNAGHLAARCRQLLMQQHGPGVRQEREGQEPQQPYPQPQKQPHCNAQYLQQIDLAVSGWASAGRPPMVR